MIMKNFFRRYGAQNGETLLGLLAGLTLGTVVLTAAVSNFMQASRMAKDHETINQAQTQANTLVDLMAFELRMIGSGMPIAQGNFQITDATLGTAVLPILLTATATQIPFRLNETGDIAVLTANYTPAVGSLQFAVNSIINFAVGNTVYLSDMTSTGNDGMQGTIASIVGTNITVEAGYVANAGATFDSGNTVERVTLVTYNSPIDWSGVTRNDGSGAIVLAPNSTFTLAYRDSAGATIALPLTADSIQNTLASINVTVYVRGDKPLFDGGTYTAQASHTVALRNLNLIR